MSDKNIKRIAHAILYFLTGATGGIITYLFNKNEVNIYIWFLAGFTLGAFCMMISCAVEEVLGI